MKINILGTLILAVTIIWSGCNKIEEATDIEFEATYNADLDVVVPSGQRSATFNSKTTIDPLSDPKVAQYINKIKNYKVLMVNAEITSISEDVTLLNAKLEIYTDANNAEWNLTNLPLSQGAQLELGNENGQWDTVKQILEEKKEFTIELTGETDKGDVSFTVRVSIKAKVTANPL